MEYIIQVEYNKVFFKNIFKEEHKTFIRIFKIISIIVTLLSILSFTVALSGHLSFEDDFINLLLTILIWGLYFNLPLLIANVQMIFSRKRKIDGVHILSFDNQTISVNYVDYNRNVSFPINKIKNIKKIGGFYKIWISRKCMYINIDSFEMGNAEEFYNWLDNITQNVY